MPVALLPPDPRGGFPPRSPARAALRRVRRVPARCGPRSLRYGLPPIGERWGGFGESSQVDVRERVLGALGPKAWLRRSCPPGVRNGRSSSASFGRSGPRPGSSTSSTSSTRCSRTARRRSSRRDASTRAQRKPRRSRTTRGRWHASDFRVDQALQQHLLQVGYVDRLVGALVRRLEETGLYDRALVVVAADHGIGFEPGGSARSVTEENLPDIAGVPLFVKYPGQRRGLVDRRDAETIDIVPTIADVIGVPIPWHVDGRSLRGKPVVRRVWVRGPRSGSVSAPANAVAAGVLSTARRNAALFGQGRDSLYRLGPHQELLGRSGRSIRVVDHARSGGSPGRSGAVRARPDRLPVLSFSYRG